MKTIFKLAIALLALFSFAACSDVPMPYDEPGTSDKEKPTTEAEAKGTGTATDPYNVAGALKVVSALAAGEETPAAIYVKGAVKEIKQIETENFGNANYYITDDGKNQIYIFQSYYLGNRKFTADDKLTVGDTVVVYGKFTNYNGNTPETVGKGTSYIYSLNGKTAGTKPETPTTGDPKGTGTAADPYNAAGANKAAEGMKDGDKKENVYVSGIISKIKSVSTQFGNAEFYISDDGKTEGSQFYVFRALYLNGAKFTAEAQIKVGQKVVVKGSLVNYKGNTPELEQGCQIVSIEGEGSGTPATGDITMKAGDFGVATTNEMGTQTLSDGTTLTFDKGSNNNAPKYYSTGSGTIRLYPGNTIAINAGSKKVASITIVCDSYQGTDYTAEGKLTSTKGTVSLSNLTYTISNIDASTFTLTNGDTGTGGKTQLRALSITITYAK